MLLSCCGLHRTSPEHLNSDSFGDVFDFEYNNKMDCCFLSTFLDLKDTQKDRYIYIMNADSNWPCRQERAAKAERQPIIETVPGLATPAGSDGSVALQIEVGARLYGYDTVLVDINRLHEQLQPPGVPKEIGQLAGLCSRLGLALVRLRASGRAPGTGITPAW